MKECSYSPRACAAATPTETAWTAAGVRRRADDCEHYLNKYKIQNLGYFESKLRKIDPYQFSGFETCFDDGWFCCPFIYLVYH